MEFKVLIYIVIGLVWLFSRIISAKAKGKEGGSVLPESWTKPFEGQIEEMFPGEIRKAIKRKEARNTKPVTSKLNVGLERIGIPEGGFKRKSHLEMDEIVISQVQILDDMSENGANNIALELNYEIKNGTFDWKRAVVINELMSHQHFR